MVVWRSTLQACETQTNNFHDLDTTETIAMWMRPTERMRELCRRSEKDREGTERDREKRDRGTERDGESENDTEREREQREGETTREIL